ncbi:MAG: hypothetical protein Q7T72_11145 [Bacteroidales bacterium]|nr:hypothetical protein [Bacteroidales bacterium]MDP3002283.1 hypothetical protein [Bacteroidales bacterium]
MNYKIIITINLILLIFNSLLAQSVSEMRSYIKTVPVGKETSLEVFNKYGTIQITPWNKDSAYIRAEVKAFAPDQAKLKKMFDGISVNITETPYLVRAKTDFTQNINILFESFKGITSKLISYDSRVEINYYISIPEYLDLKIENKYGDVYMEDNTGTFSISVSNGSFKANSLGKGSSLTMAFCDATINSMTSGNIDASFSEISIGETGDISINSISSRYEIKKAGIIRSESRRDKFFIDNIETLQGNSYFTDYKVNNLKKELNLTTRYGSVNADLIEKGFEAININSGYSDISLGFDPGSSYNLDIRHINAFLVLPDKNINTEQKALNEEKKEFMTYGTVGRNPGTTKVKIDATRGNIYLK